MGAESLTWQCLKEGKNFLSTSSFNLYIIDIDYRYICDGFSVVRSFNLS